MQNALHPRGDIDRSNGSRIEGGGGRLACIEDSVNASIQKLEDYIKKIKEILITAAHCNSDNLSTDRKTKNRRQK